MRLMKLAFLFILSLCLCSCSSIRTDDEVELYTVYGEVQEISTDLVCFQLGKIKVHNKDFFQGEDQLSLIPNGEELELSTADIAKCFKDSLSEGMIMEISYTKSDEQGVKILFVNRLKNDFKQDDN